MKYLVWSDRDPNDSFEVEAGNLQDALFIALDELGWSIGESTDDDPEHEGLDNMDLWGNVPMT